MSIPIHTYVYSYTHICLFLYTHMPIPIHTFVPSTKHATHWSTWEPETWVRACKRACMRACVCACVRAMSVNLRSLRRAELFPEFRLMCSTCSHMRTATKMRRCCMRATTKTARWRERRNSPVNQLSFNKFWRWLTPRCPWTTWLTQHLVPTLPGL